MKAKIFQKNRSTKNICSPLVYGLLVFFGLQAGNQSFAQTPGVIFKPAAAVAGVNPLDPNQDGYTSAGTAGFSGGDTGSNSEIPYIALPQVALEPTGDLGPGPACKFTDIVDNGQERGVSYYVSGSNYLFRFRLGGSAPNAKGYSILIDTDQRFGTSGSTADPNAVPGNPGFEIEVLLTTGGSTPGVNVYNTDGKSYSSTTAPVITSLSGGNSLYPLSTNFQKSVAVTTNCGDLDVFYDFFIPVSALQAAYTPSLAYPAFSTAVPIRMVANTVIAPVPALHIQQISDLNGAGPLSNYGGNIENAWSTLVNNYPPTSPSGNPSIQDRSQPPVVAGPLVANPGTTSTITGTSTEATGTTISVYKNGALLGTTSVLSGGTWSYAVAAGTLATGDNISATALAANEVESAQSNAVTVGGNTCTGLPSRNNISITCQGKKGVFGTVNGGVPIGSTVRLYEVGVTGISSSAQLTTTTIDAAGLFQLKCNTNVSNCNSGSGNDCLFGLAYLLTVQEPGKCESGFSNATYCSLSGNQANNSSAAPSFSTPTLTTATTTLTGTISPSAYPTTVFLLADGGVIGSATISSGTTFTISSLIFQAGNEISAFAISAGKCVSSTTMLGNVTSTAPRILAPIFTNSTSITGTSIEAAGTLITVYSSAALPTSASPGTILGTTTVDANGSWSLATTGVTLTANNYISAAVTNISGTGVSSLSNAVIVGSTVAVVPTVNGPVTEGQMSISGTVPAGYATGSVIYVYEDDFLIGTATISGTTWNLTGLSNIEGNEKYLYAGSVIKAAVGPNITDGSSYIGAKSAGVTVNCGNLTVSNSVTATPPSICANSSTDIVIGSSVIGYVYTLENNTSGTTLGTSRTGTGSNLTIPTGALTSTTTIRVKAMKIGATNCSATLTNTAVVTVNPLPVVTNAVTAATPICTGAPVFVTVANSQAGFTYQLRNGATNVGTALAGNGGNQIFPAGNIAYNSNITYNVLVSNSSLSTCSSQLTQTVTVRQDCPAVYTQTLLLNRDAYTNGFVAATVTDPDGAISAASVTGGTFPAGFSINATSGIISVSNATLVPASGTFTFQVQTTDVNGGTTSGSVTITLIADTEAIYANTTVNQDVPAGTVLATVTDANGSITTAALTSGSLPAGTILNANGTITVQNQNLMVSGSYPVSVFTTDAQGGTTLSNIILVVNADQEATYAVTAAPNWYDNPTGTVLATLTDADGAITSVSVGNAPSNTFPAGAVSVNTQTGQISVAGQGLLKPGVMYTIELVTTDNKGGTSAVLVSITFSGDRDGDGVNDFNDLDANNDGVVNHLADLGANALADADGDNLMNFADPDFIHPVFGSWKDQNSDGINDWFDMDLDGILNLFDLDIDGDGILNTLEANGGTVPAAATGFSLTQGRYSGSVTVTGIPSGSLNNNGETALAMPNTDGDYSLAMPLADYRDLDSDNDGLTDNYEAQESIQFVNPTGADANRNGIDNRYDLLSGGTALLPVNSDATVAEPFSSDILPDYLDLNSDGDAFADSNEGFDNNENGRSVDDLLARATQFAAAGGNPNYYNNALISQTPANPNADLLPNWLLDFDHDEIRNYLDEDSPYYFDTDKDGLIDLFDPNNFGAPASPPDNNNNSIPDFRDNGTFTSLPVELLGFSATPVNNEVLVKWVTAMEKDNDHFVVERSKNGLQFTAIGTVARSGNSEYQIDYQFTDVNPLAGLSYYRLRQVDTDGTSTYSKAVTVQLTEQPELTLQAYPNPFQSQVQVEVNAAEAGEMTLRVTDMLGTGVFLQKITVNNGRNLLQFQFDSLPAGTYLLNVSNASGQVIQKLVKE